MNTQLEIEQFLEMASTIPVIDVRSPKEFEHAHIPGAFNLPIFDNDERTKVGISYKHEGRETAILLGLKLVGPKLADLAKKARKIAHEKKVLVHCWRGGMRSSSMAWLINTIGVQTFTLKGGYKSYRRYIKSEFAKEANLVVIGGMTGSGKTKILHEISKMGHQVIDLEQLANHKGSAFGALGQNEQCSTEQFENNLYEIWKTLDLKKPIWVEDESKTIGKIWLPDEIFARMRSCDVIDVEIPANKRVKFLAEEYGTFEADKLKESIVKIQKRLGGNNAKAAIEAIDNKDIEKAIEIVLYYYDKTYKYGLSQRNKQSIRVLKLENADHQFNAKQVITFFKKLNIC